MMNDDKKNVSLKFSIRQEHNEQTEDQKDTPYNDGECIFTR